jgi:hypothetical protein
MYKDPIVEEVRKHRQARAARFGYDIEAMAEDARKRERKSGHRMVNLQELDKQRKMRVGKATAARAKV